MKRILTIVLLVFSVSAFVSCKKDSSNPSSNYLQAKIDGEQKTFNSNLIGAKVDTSGVIGIGILGFASSDLTGPSMSLDISKASGDITAGTYTQDYSNEDLIVLGNYAPTVTSTTDAFTSALGENPESSMTITITTITSDRITGTFNGTWLNNNGDGPDKIVVTDGQFSVPLTH